MFDLFGVSGCDDDKRAYLEQVECQALAEIPLVYHSLQEVFSCFFVIFVPSWRDFDFIVLRIASCPLCLRGEMSGSDLI